MTKKITAVYQCNLCHKIIEVHNPFPIALDSAPNELGEFDDNIVHNCSRYIQGIASLRHFIEDKQPHERE